MCGIVGIARGPDEAPVSVADVRRMADAIVHRGPDDEGFHADGNVVIGMRRLSIIDLAGGHQPISNEDGTVTVVCNGEIYNFRALRADLQARGHRFRTGSDVEVLVHLYEEYGDAFLEHVSGMYGLALWDARRRRLTLARDRLGQKPLYYRVTGRGIAFASEVKALLKAPGISAGLDRDALREHLAIGYCVAPRTIFEGVRKLPPATRLVWDASGIATDRYWQLPRQVRTDWSAEHWVEAVRTELRRAVADHMVSDVPIGAFLSGGIDSSAVVALMAEQSTLPVNTYSIGYGGSATSAYFNELEYAGQVARLFKTSHHEIVVAPDVARLLPKLLWHVEEPISDSAVATTFLVAELAAKSVKVILSGVGGDELFAGYRRYLGEHYQRRFRRLPGWVRQQVVQPLARALPSGRQNRVMDLARYARKFIQASDLSWQAQYRLYIEILARDQVAGLLVGGGPPEAGFLDGFDRVLADETSEDALLRLMRVDAQTQLPEDLLLLTDKITMATSIECRVPFLDDRLVELAAQAPAETKLGHGQLKQLLKQSLRGVLPDEILDRSKRGFGAPMGEWFKRDLRPLREALLNPAVVESRGYLSAPGVQAVLQAHDANREDYSDLLLVLMNLEIWCRLFLDQRSVEDVAGELSERARAA
jgi:asparagine synthase (glutamine-hydrolysing)